MFDPSGPQAVEPNRPTTEPVRHLTQLDLARRWRMSERTLERWRCQRVGPAHLKVVGHVIYRVDDVEAYEAQQRRG
jgi:hypothetical protein